MVTTGVHGGWLRERADGKGEIQFQGQGSLGGSQGESELADSGSRLAEGAICEAGK